MKRLADIFGQSQPAPAVQEKVVDSTVKSAIKSSLANRPILAHSQVTARQSYQQQASAAIVDRDFYVISFDGYKYLLNTNGFSDDMMVDDAMDAVYKNGQIVSELEHSYLSPVPNPPTPGSLMEPFPTDYYYFITDTQDTYYNEIVRLSPVFEDSVADALTKYIASKANPSIQLGQMIAPGITANNPIPKKPQAPYEHVQDRVEVGFHAYICWDGERFVATDNALNPECIQAEGKIVGEFFESKYGKLAYQKGELVANG